MRRDEVSRISADRQVSGGDAPLAQAAADAAVQRYRDEAAAVRYANDTSDDLAVYAFTRDQTRSWRLALMLEAGMVAINEGGISTEVAPFGGVKQSGYGREGSSQGLAHYQSIKTFTLGGLTESPET